MQTILNHVDNCSVELETKQVRGKKLKCLMGPGIKEQWSLEGSERRKL